tara:strand:- start:5500 stop:6591 length:1092 start_codon:yes stop_codon:yes gene_type:complete
MLLTLIFKNRSKINQISKPLRGLFSVLVFWGIITMLRGISFSLQDLVTNFGNVYMAWAWALPLTLILGLKIENWTIVLNVIKLMFSLMIIAFLISLAFDNSYLQWAWLLRPVNMLLLLGLYRFSLINKLQMYLIIAVLIIVALQVKQRMDLLYLSITFSFLMLNKLASAQIKRVFIKYIIFGFVLIVTLIFTVGYELVSNFMATLIDFQDSRTFLFNELMAELSSFEKIVGRGSLGTYFSQFMEHTKWYTVEILKKPWWGDSSTRITIEVGYLQMILKGGVTLMILNFIFFMTASYTAIFKSHNRFIKALGYYILIISILSIVSMRPAFTPTFILFWMAIGTVLSKKHREMNDEEINALIKFK